MFSELTIVLTAQNVSSYIGQTLVSLEPVLAQGGRLIVVDDASTDETVNLIRDFLPKGYLAELIENSQPLGPGINRNNAIDRVETKFFATIDGDDWVTQNYYQNLLAPLQDDSTLDYVRSHHTRVYGVRREARRAPIHIVNVAQNPADFILPIDRPTMVDYPYLWAGMYRTEFWRNEGVRYSPTFTAEDRLTIWQLHTLANRFMVVDEYGYMYRRDLPGSLTNVGDVRQLAFLDVLSAVIEYANTDALLEYRNKAYRQVLALVHYHLVNSKRLDAQVRVELERRLPSLGLLMSGAETRQVLEDMGANRAHLLSRYLYA
jgi:glycosyltransferase involved in cell wall biosynthesis